jgi:hypothetical protein
MSRPKIAFVDAFADLPDPRVDRGKKHQLYGILVIAVCAAKPLRSETQARCG